MTTIVLVIIGVLLAAASALFVVFYGGDAFNGGSDKAHASTLINSGINVESAVTGYRSQNGGDPSSLSDLQGDGDGEWLSKGGMQIASAATGTPEIGVKSGVKAYRVAGVTSKVCSIINANYHVEGSPNEIGELRRGCHADGSDHVYFIRLSGGAPAKPNPDDVRAVVSAGDAALVAAAGQVESVPNSVAALGGADYGRWADGAQSVLYEADVPEGGTRLFVFTPMGAAACNELNGGQGVPGLDLSTSPSSKCGNFAGQIYHAVEVGGATIGKLKSRLTVGIFEQPTPFDYYQYRMNLVHVPRWLCNGIQRSEGVTVDSDADFSRGSGCGRFFGTNYYYSPR